MPIIVADNAFFISPNPPKLLDQAREVIRYKHYSLRTERSYLAWMKKIILFHGKRHPKVNATPKNGGG